MGGDRPRWGHALAAWLAFRLNDHDAAVSTLTALVHVLRDRNQPPRAADALLELADLHHDAGDTLALAATLAELGEIMLTGERPRLARTYFTRAIDQLNQTPDRPAALWTHVHEFRGHALSTLGNTTLSRREFREALTYVDSDDLSTRERLEALVHRIQSRRRHTAPIDNR